MSNRKIDGRWADLAETCATELRVERKLKCNRPSPHSPLSILTLPSEAFPHPPPSSPNPISPGSYLGVSSIISSTSPVPTREATGDNGGNREAHNSLQIAISRYKLQRGQRNGTHLSAPPSVSSVHAPEGCFFSARLQLGARERNPEGRDYHPPPVFNLYALILLCRCPPPPSLPPSLPPSPAGAAMARNLPGVLPMKISPGQPASRGRWTGPQRHEELLRRRVPLLTRSYQNGALRSRPVTPSALFWVNVSPMELN